MNYRWFLVSLVGILVQLTPTQAADPAKGKAFAEAHCSRCHAIGSEGDSPFPPAPPFRLLPNRYNIDDLAEAFAEGMVVGHDAMPQFELPPDQITDLLAYIDSLDGSE